jgi:hypothetical protein
VPITRSRVPGIEPPSRDEAALRFVLHALAGERHPGFASGRLRATVMMPISRGVAGEPLSALVHGRLDAPSSNSPRWGSHSFDR